MLNEHGIFSPPRGEVETWLPELGKKDVDKKKWLGEMFAAMGSLDDSATYIAPRDGDVWDFMREIAKWIDDHAFNVHGPDAEPTPPSPTREPETGGSPPDAS